MAERRNTDEIGALPGKGDAKEANRVRRMGERRDSPRVPMKFLLRDIAEGGSYEERDGDLAIGGIYWKGKHAPVGTEVEVRFRLKGVPSEVRAKGEIIRVSDQGKGLDFHVRFTELDVKSELAIARFIDSNGRG